MLLLRCCRSSGFLLQLRAVDRGPPSAGRCFRSVSNEAGGRYRCYGLSHRQLLRLQGRDTGAFLQGLITNDVEDVMSGRQEATYCHLLNLQGRTLFDVILYRLHKSKNEEPAILLECDATLLDAVQKHLKVYKIRRKMKISPCPELSLWSVLSFAPSTKAGSALEVNAKKVVVCTIDPRTDAMGWRLVLNKMDNPLAIVPGSHLGDIQDYHRYRYQVGIAEGVKDLPSGEAIPLESNLVYMNGISFTKGCYIGQELTARTHYTGVIRKRLMPIQLDNPLQPGSLPEKAQIVTESGKSAGRLRSYTGDVGLALVRLAFANEPLHLRTKGDAQVLLKASVPDWWPSDENK
ncbi:putative transferase CAF17 homolog, mitochondrial [Stegostoma tigrinum]|uniref:putative transferase CAF17 homolog, mitochondrial n=1 Tax=Stegostoma tigrinum TaxID=3053191 RepID=UPI0028701E62|nr:putative transferase CAF17 homolog, mitochondrial [Stegostoma tigrinum]